MKDYDATLAELREIRSDERSSKVRNFCFTLGSIFLFVGLFIGGVILHVIGVLEEVELLIEQAYILAFLLVVASSPIFVILAAIKYLQKG